jgi:CheY-like chemotaxis protein
MPKKILLVDDEADMVNVMSFRLKKAGYEVVTAETGAQALEKANTESPDLILLDINLPDIAGFEVCSRLKSGAATKQIPVIFVSASVDSVKSVTEKCGAQDFIVKPYEPQELISKIGSYLEGNKIPAEAKINTVEVDEEIEKLIPAFIEGKRKNVADLREASMNADYAKIQSIGHGWHGSGKVYNFNFISEKGAALEAAAQGGRIEEVRNLISEIEKYFNSLEIKFVKVGDIGKRIP